MRFWLGARGAELMDAILGWFPHPSSEWLDPETAEEKSYLDRREDGLMPATFFLGERPLVRASRAQGWA